jgi:hypothetical protein
MSSIVGEKPWRNAESLSTLASINNSIAAVTESLNTATKLYQQASDNLTACYGKSKKSCLSLTGGYAISTWTPQYDHNKALITQYTAKLSELLKLQTDLSATQATTATTVTAAAAAQDALAKADIATSSASAGKWGLYIGVGLGAIALIIGGVIIFKKLKK